MSVFTPVSRQQLVDFINCYDCGELIDFTGISAGIENTNYFVTTSAGQYVLTIFESLSVQELPYYLDLMAFFAEAGLPSAHPQPDSSGKYLRLLLNKPAALVQRLVGSSIEQPTVDHCRAVGAMLGRLHRLGQAFTHHRVNSRGAEWREEVRSKLHGLLTAEELALLDDEMTVLAIQDASRAPVGVIHADLFRDNVLFDNGQLSGVIDFYYACNDLLLLDLAVTVNDWCGIKGGGLADDRVLLLLTAYHGQRPLLSVERAVWPFALRAAALRFWLSRLHDTHFQREGEITHTKNPNEFKLILCHRREHRDQLMSLWDQAIQA